QSAGLATEMLEEMRERLVSLDILLVGKLNRDLVARPDFREAYLDQLAERHPRFHRLGMSQTLAGTYAGPVTRLVAFLVDVIILLLVVGLISAFVSSTLNLFGLTDRAVNFLFSGGIVSTIVLFIAIAFNFIVIGAYFILAWNWTGATVGDALFGLHVVSKRGERVSILHSIMRLIGMYISVIVFLLGFIWALFDRRRQGWHDKFGGTFVLYAWPAQADERFLHAQVTAELDESGSAG
ncbi:MAG: RDD family protein, partial [Chloroflexota bacterium]